MKFRCTLASVTILFSHSVLAESPLEKYVHAPDDSFGWEIVESQEGDKHTVLLVDMVSQNWLTAKEVDRTEWRHWLVITVPEEVTPGPALLYISGGSNNGNQPSANESTLQIASLANAVVGELRMVPNQPLVFHDDGNARYEDDLLAYSWVQYLQSNDPRWLPRGAMVKAAVRAMDTITAVMSEEEQGALDIDEFVVAGGSKRGWTTWMTGAFDDRVVAIAPIVIDVLNVKESMKHHFEAYGFWAPSIGDYVNHGIMKEWDNPKLTELYRLVDPYHYLDQLKMPKLVLNATGDQFFLPDSSQFYWEELKGPKYLRYVPNGEHSLGGTDGIETLAVFFTMIRQEIEFPVYRWEVSEANVLKVFTEQEPQSIQHWQANNPTARDFRVTAIGPSYAATDVAKKSDGVYEVALGEPESGWTANLVELTFDVGLPKPLKLSTPVYVLPDELPFAGKHLDLETSITLVCRGNSDAYGDLIEVSNSVASEYEFDVEQIQANGNLYLNWNRPDVFGARFGLIRQAFDGRGCENPAIQLESGPDITLPPITFEDPET